MTSNHLFGEFDSFLILRFFIASFLVRRWGSRFLRFDFGSESGDDILPPLGVLV